jgi:hypothetical protein
VNSVLIHKNRCSKSDYDPDKCVLQIEFVGIVDKDQILEQFQSISEFVEINRVVGTISDLRKLYGSPIKLFDFMREFYFPFLIECGLQAECVLVREDHIIKNVGLKWVNMVKGMGLKSDLFENNIVACKWLYDAIKI